MATINVAAITVDHTSTSRPVQSAHSRSQSSSRDSGSASQPDSQSTIKSQRYRDNVLSRRPLALVAPIAPTAPMHLNHSRPQLQVGTVSHELQGHADIAIGTKSSPIDVLAARSHHSRMHNVPFSRDGEATRSNISGQGPSFGLEEARAIPFPVVDLANTFNMMSQGITHSRDKNVQAQVETPSPDLQTPVSMTDTSLTNQSSEHPIHSPVGPRTSSTPMNKRKAGSFADSRDMDNVTRSEMMASIRAKKQKISQLEAELEEARRKKEKKREDLRRLSHFNVCPLPHTVTKGFRKMLTLAKENLDTEALALEAELAEFCSTDTETEDLEVSFPFDSLYYENTIPVLTPRPLV
jgi:hypothetical protein